MPHPKGKLDLHQLKMKEAHAIEDRILSLLLGPERPMMSLRAIAEGLDVSTATASKYLHALSKQGSVIKVYTPGRSFYQWGAPRKVRAVTVSPEFEKHLALRQHEIEIREKRRKFLSLRDFEKLYPSPRRKKCSPEVTVPFHPCIW
jgi:DNA-binding transcriptional regulator YhcF (GntR family)